jgi:hypothetical protein
MPVFEVPRPPVSDGDEEGLGEFPKHPRFGSAALPQLFTFHPIIEFPYKNLHTAH